jgi:DNA-binding PadR family transcriptional regulator
VADAARLGPSSHVILGILAAAGPQTPYSLKQIIGRTIGYYWPFPHAQIYSETARLAELGLAVEEQEPSGLRRKRYAITAEGQAALESWLAAPTPDPAQFRDLGLLKLAFGSLSSPEARQALRTDQIAAHVERLAAYERYASMPLDPFLRATLDLGLRYERAALEFWRSLDFAAEAPTAS